MKTKGKHLTPLSFSRAFFESGLFSRGQGGTSGRVFLMGFLERNKRGQ
jgi:hypothetical protein